MKCELCPRRCGVDRSVETGFCGCGEKAVVAHSMLHFWEEPCISGKNGSGCVFFAGCQLKCVYCQNRSISRGSAGKEYSVRELAELFVSLERKGANNINLVTPDHFALQIRAALREARRLGMTVPAVYNCSGYVCVETLRALADDIDIYLTDFKYMSSELAERYSSCPDYPDRAKEALCEMVRQHPLRVYGADGMMRSGVIVRHLILPGNTADSIRVLDHLHARYGDAIQVSLMNQFTPIGLENYQEINRKLTTLEYDRVIKHALSIGMENVYIQEKGTASESFIPEFRPQ